MKELLCVAAVLALGLTACGGAIESVRARPTPASTVFDPEELVDVLAPDTIPAVDRPRFESAEAASTWLGPQEPVVVVEIAGQARAYPLAILTWHEIVNDTIGGTPVAVTYCPLCNSAIAFDRRIGGTPDTFGVSGKLYRSDLVMFDRRTDSLWPQIWGRAVRGPLEGTELTRIPSQIVSLEEFRAAHPTGVVMSRDTGATRSYGANPYPRYDTRAEPYDSFFPGRGDTRLARLERVVGVAIGSEARAYPYARLREAGGVINDRLGGRDVVVLWRSGTRSALDSPAIAQGRDVGAAGVFVPAVEGSRLDFTATAAGFRDRQTGTTWSLLGVGIEGRLAGKRLERIEHVDAFWFAWAAFVPFTSVFRT